MSKVKSNGSGQIFQNKYLEFLTRTHPAIIVGMYVPLCSLSIYYHSTNFSHSIFQSLGITALGLLSWSLAEYLLHRYAFHYINDTKVVQKFHYAVHGVHHEFPNDKSRLIMPPVPSLLFAGAFFLIFWLIIGSAVYAFLPGFILGYLGYALMHYSMHAFKPPFKWIAPLWKHHHVHHHMHPEKAFGVSSTLWDHIFGTMPPDPKSKKTSAHA